MGRPTKKQKASDTENQNAISSFDDVKRIMKGDIKFYVDTFKLDVATMKKNIAPIGDGFAPNYLPMEHSHIFHTRDKKGNENKTCAPVGGHYHEVYLEVVNGEFRGRTSTPLQNRGSEKIAPLTDARGRVVDSHTHEVIYIKSDETTLQKLNPEVMKVYSELHKQVTTPSDELAKELQ